MKRPRDYKIRHRTRSVPTLVTKWYELKGNASPVAIAQYMPDFAGHLSRRALVEIDMRILAAAVSVCLLFGMQGIASAAPGDAIYARPGQLVTAQGTRLNFY